jgi:serine protease Do
MNCLAKQSSAVLIALLGWWAHAQAAAPLPKLIDSVQPKIVKIFGAGGLRGLEAYQSGFLISADGRVLTAWSYVLDTEEINVTLHDGRRFRAALLGADAQYELAVLKIDADDLPHFKLDEAATADVGTRVLAFSNVFGVAVGDEPASVQHGIVAIVADLDARRGVFATPYRGPVYVLDAMTNNPGAAGGALTNHEGQLVGVLGKELRNAATNTWLNYAIPATELSPVVAKLSQGQFVAAQQPAAVKPRQPNSLELLGVVTVPNVVERTPPFVDHVVASSTAAVAGLQADDLIVTLNGRLVPSIDGLSEELAKIERFDPVTFGILRDNKLIELTLQVEDR